MTIRGASGADAEAGILVRCIVLPKCRAGPPHFHLRPAHPLPARPRPHHPLQNLPPPQAQDPGVPTPQRATTTAPASPTRWRSPRSPAPWRAALRLNEDLTEAIALGHDLGHTPFGHAGERALERDLPGRLPPQRAERAGGASAWRRAGAGLNLTVRGAGRHPLPHLPAAATRNTAGGPPGALRGQDRLHEPRHRRRRSAPASSQPDELPRLASQRTLGRRRMPSASSAMVRESIVTAAVGPCPL